MLLTRTEIAKPSIVLVHGAFADATSWQHVIPLLESDGYTVTAVQNTLTSLPDDIATTKRVIDAQKGAVIVVGHSYGGIVITGAAAGNPNVQALVYIAAFAPDAGETLATLNAKYAASPLIHAVAPDAAGFLYIDREKFRVFAQDVSIAEALVMAATQKPLAKPLGTRIASVVFEQAVDNVAWKTIPSWYLVSQEDQAIPLELQRFMAKRMGAKTTEIKASHVAFISHPSEVVKLIETAAAVPVRVK
jgi:pimeloyl-ACP methyl ester carboxylesterase